MYIVYNVFICTHICINKYIHVYLKKEGNNKVYVVQV